MTSNTMRFEKLLEAVPDALVGMDQKGVIRFVNRQSELLFGYDRDQLIGEPIGTLVPEPLWQIYAEHRQGFFADPRTRSSGLEVVLSGRHHNGGEFPINVSMSHIDTGDVLLVITGADDVSAQQRAIRNAGLTTAIVEYSDDAIIGATLGGTITSWNPAAEKMYGYSADEIIGRSGQLLIPQDRSGVMGGLLADLTAGHHVEHLETTRVRRDGTVFPVSVNGAPIYDDNGTIVGVSASHRDVTEQRRAFEAAQQMAAIVNDSDDAIISGTLDGIITSWNPGAERMYGYSSAEIIGKPGGLLIPADRVPEMTAVFDKLRAGQHVERLETERVRRDGTVVPVSLAIAAIRDKAGAVVGAAAIHHDMTRQRQALQAAQSLASIVENSNDAIIARTLEGVITSWNPAAARMFGYSADEIIGKPTDLLIPEDQADEAKTAQAKISTGQPVEHLETSRVRKDGTVFPASITFSPVRDADGAVVGVSVIYRDTTEQAQAASALAETSRQYRLLAENASDLVVLTSPDRVITWVSPSVTRTLGWATEELIGTRLVALMHPDDVAATTTAREVVYSGNEPATPQGGFLMRMRTKSGQYQRMSGAATPVTAESGVLVAVVAGLRLEAHARLLG
jgi:PAS domain S-box-containing protein